MDGGFPEHYVAYDGEEDQVVTEDHYQQQFYTKRGIDSFNNVADSAGDDLNNSNSHRDSSSGKLFVGGIAWETTQETFTNYFCKYGETTDAIIMMDKFSGRPRGFGFVTFADPAIADKVLEEDHVIDGRAIEVKKTVPREEMPVRGVQKTRKIFVGGLPSSFTEDEMKEYFSSYGCVVEHQIMFDRETGRSRGFGFVTFESEEAVEGVLSDGRAHELGGKPVEIKKAVPKRFGGDYANDERTQFGGSASKTYGGFRGGATEYRGGYSGKIGREYVDYGSYGEYGGNYGGGAAGFYGGYGGYGYGFGFWGPMYSSGAYGGSVYGAYGGGAGYGGSVAGGFGGGVAGGFGGVKGYGGGSKGYGTGGAATGRYHPYRK